MHGSRETERIKRRDKWTPEEDVDSWEKKQNERELRRKKRERKAEEEPEEK